MNYEPIVQSIYYSYLQDKEFREEFNKDPIKKLRDAGLDDETEQVKFLAYMNSPDHLIGYSFQETMKLAERFKVSVKTSLEQIEGGYRGAMWMYWLAFLTGVLLIITAVVFAIIKKENLLSIVFGSLGTLDLLVFFVMKPPLELQNSRIGFARLEAAFMNWFVDLTNLNSLFQPLQVSYGLANPQPGQPKLQPDAFDKYLEKALKISDQSINNTAKTLEMMGKIIREEAGKPEKINNEVTSGSGGG